MSIVMLAMILVMATVTYIIRVIPMAFFRKKITSKYLCSVLYYTPYAVLSAMTFPFIIYSTGNTVTAAVGTVVALLASLTKRSLIIVATLSCVAVLILNYII